MLKTIFFLSIWIVFNQCTKLFKDFSNIHIYGKYNKVHWFMKTFQKGWRSVALGAQIGRDSRIETIKRPRAYVFFHLILIIRRLQNLYHEKTTNCLFSSFFLFVFFLFIFLFVVNIFISQTITWMKFHTNKVYYTTFV